MISNSPGLGLGLPPFSWEQKEEAILNAMSLDTPAQQLLEEKKPPIRRSPEFDYSVPTLVIENDQFRLLGQVPATDSSFRYRSFQHKRRKISGDSLSAPSPTEVFAKSNVNQIYNAMITRLVGTVEPMSQ